MDYDETDRRALYEGEIPLNPFSVNWRDYIDSVQSDYEKISKSEIASKSPHNEIASKSPHNEIASKSPHSEIASKLPGTDTTNIESSKSTKYY